MTGPVRVALPTRLPLSLSGQAAGEVAVLGGATMGTSWSVKAILPAGTGRDIVQRGIEALLDIIIAQMSNWDAASDISRFNRSVPGTWQAMPDLFLHVVRNGLDIAVRSGGAFDPAIGDAVERWGFGPSRIIADGDRAAPQSGWTSIEVESDRARRLADVALDFSGIAKGFAVDAVSRLLTSKGIANHLVEIGGELRGEGLRPDGQPWWVDLEVPPGLDLPRTRVGLTGLSVATSGDYRRYFERDGQRFAHSIDPRTGTPVRNGVASVTVCDPSAMRADAWATAICVLGVEQGLKLAEREGLAALIIDRGAAGVARDHMSTEFERMLG